jgi:hypothetical protein
VLQRRYGAFAVTPPYPIEVMGASRVHLPDIFTELGFTKGAEIGVWKGEFAAVLCQIPNLHLLCVDPWVPYQDYGDHTIRTHISAAYEETRTRLRGFDVRFILQFSVEAAALIPNESLDFCYIDANHRYEYVVADLAAWLPKVRKGGVICGHDYKSISYRPDLQVVEAVDGWTKAYKVAPWYVLGRTRTRPGEVRDKHRSWLWEKT